MIPAPNIIRLPRSEANLFLFNAAYPRDANVPARARVHRDEQSAAESRITRPRWALHANLKHMRAIGNSRHARILRDEYVLAYDTNLLYMSSVIY